MQLSIPQLDPYTGIKNAVKGCVDILLIRDGFCQKLSKDLCKSSRDSDATKRSS